MSPNAVFAYLTQALKGDVRRFTSGPYGTEGNCKVGSINFVYLENMLFISCAMFSLCRKCFCVIFLESTSGCKNLKIVRLPLHELALFCQNMEMISPNICQGNAHRFVL